MIEFKVSGRRALFTDPISKIGGEKFSYPIPTYQSLKGITESIYWKPTIVWHIDRARVMRQIRSESQNMRTLGYAGGNSLSIYSYLADVEYQVQAHFEWNKQRDDLVQDRNENKHYFSAKRMVERGGRRDIFLGTRECQGYVDPCRFGEGEGHYDESCDMPFGLMFHGFDYPDETGVDEVHSRFWNPIMSKGVVEFIDPSDCTIKRYIHDMTPKNIPINAGKDSEGENR